MAINPQVNAAVWPGPDVYDTLIATGIINSGINNLSNTSSNFSINIYYSDNTTPFQYQGLPVGIYSLNDGVWYDMNGQDGPIIANIGSNTDGSVQLSWTIPVGGVPGYTLNQSFAVTFKVGILTIAGTETLTLPIGGSLLSYNTGVNYQKISLKGEVAAVASTSGTTLGVTVPHNLGYVPTFRVWKRQATTNRIVPAAQFGVVGGGIRIDSTNLYMDGLTNETGSWIYRIYKD